MAILTDWRPTHPRAYSMTCATSLLPLSTVVLVSLLWSGCGQPEVAAYRVPKEADPTPTTAPALSSVPPAADPAPVTPGAPAAQTAMSNTPVPTASGAELTWTAPSEWKAKAATAMRKGTYTISGDAGASAELAITAFPGDVGGTVANVNRWRGQLGLSPLPDADVSTGLTQVEAHGLTATVVDFANPAASPPQRIVGAMIPFGGATWFFKLMGPEAIVAGAKPAFLKLLQTVQPATPTP